MTAQEILQTTAIKYVQIILFKTTLLIDHKTVPATDWLKKIITIYPVIILEIETTVFQNRSKNCAQSPHRNNSQYPNRQNQKYRRSTPKHQRHINQVLSANETSPSPPFDITELQLNPIRSENIDDEIDTENTLVINMLRIEHEYEHQLNRVITKMNILNQEFKSQKTFKKT